MLRTITGIFLISCLAAPFAGTYILLRHHKRSIRRVVRAQIAGEVGKEGLKQLTFSIADAERLLDWKKDDEFQYRGEMFDIMESEREGETITFWCWPDEKETLLNKKLNRVLQMLLGNDLQHRKNKDNFLQFLKSNFLPRDFHWDISLFGRDRNIFGDLPLHFKSIYLSPEPFPPKI